MQGSGVAVGGEAAERELAVAHQALLKTRDIQFDFGAAPAPPPPPGWLEPLVKLLQALAPTFKYVFWGGIILGGALILFFIVREFAPERWFRRKGQQVAVTDWRPEPEPEQARALLLDADGLAAAGRFEEAVHLLLFRSIDHLRERRPGAVKPALTSRDIAELPVLPARPREAFARLAQVVELSFFGGRPVGEGEFGAARADYEVFAFAEGWR